MDNVVREVNVRVLGKGLELLNANGRRFEICQMLFPGYLSTNDKSLIYLSINLFINYFIYQLIYFPIN